VTERSNQAPTQHTLSERQLQIIEVAMRIIATEGARCFTVQTLASEIGVTGGALYRHFPSMKAIGDAIVERIGHLLFDGFPPSASTPIERLKLFFLHRSVTICNHPHVSRLLLSDNLSQACGAEYAERLQEFKRKTRRFIVSCLKEAKTVGTLCPDVSPEIGTIIITGAIQSLSNSNPHLVSEQRPNPLAEGVWSALELMLRGTRGSVEREKPNTSSVVRNRKKQVIKAT
jgi:AcrR family transcriptional regulator